MMQSAASSPAVTDGAATAGRRHILTHITKKQLIPDLNTVVLFYCKFPEIVG